ncbi:hypothetical protein [uncultured Paraburkholderia sp.]|uniref:hypothetical protein n=1 Tax=uncultured Paraburkholderia sp. TaxID=1822466 RepID=UPI002593E474|nr:hypothetical protein [uncultured Paraburkholderia sp.]
MKLQRTRSGRERVVACWECGLRPGIASFNRIQFDRSGAIRKDVAILLAVPASKDDCAGWKRAFWLYSPHPLLDGKTPAEIFVDDPARVIAAARKEFRVDRDATW